MHLPVGDLHALTFPGPPCCVPSAVRSLPAGGVIAEDATTRGRGARLKPGATTAQQTVPWHWDASVMVAIAPGISCYVAGKEYEHGGLSPQECITPVITATKRGDDGPPVTIAGAEWRGLRCRVKLTGTTAGCRVDMRTRPADAGSSVANGIRAVGADDTPSLVNGGLWR